MPLKQSQSLGGMSPNDTTAGIGSGFAGAGNANEEPFCGNAVPFIEQTASPAIVDEAKHNAADFTPRGGREESSAVQQEGVPMWPTQWTMSDCFRESPRQYVASGLWQRSCFVVGSLGLLLDWFSSGVKGKGTYYAT